MLFNSYQFIFVFLPVIFCLYFWLNTIKKTTLSRAVLALGSIVFYGYAEYKNIALLLLSICVNYFLAGVILNSLYSSNPPDSNNCHPKLMSGILKLNAKKTLVIALIFNVSVLCYFKYMDFFIDSFNVIFHTNVALLHILLPLGISFFTITQIAYLVDCYEGRAVERNFMNYVLFVTFFPHLIAGPILHHSEMMPQFAKLKNKILQYDNLSRGLFIFFIGLFKKVVIADSFAKWANAGYKSLDSGIKLNIFEAWTTSLSYTFQLYFDFSGYCDMAIGLGLLFNIALPINFFSPYKSLNIAEFWRRWHITLGAFLRDYIYFPLGGSYSNLDQKARAKHSSPVLQATKPQPILTKILTIRNLFIVAFISGVWHGAGVGFVIWGILHGLAMCLHRIYRYVIESKFDYKFKDSKIQQNYLGNSKNPVQRWPLNHTKDIKATHPFIRFIESTPYKILCWFITFNFINIAWVFFRSEHVSTAINLIKGMFNFSLSRLHGGLKGGWWKSGQIFVNATELLWIVCFMLLACILVFMCKNSIHLLRRFNPQSSAVACCKYLIFAWSLLCYCLYKMTFFSYSEFIYFNF